MGRPKKQFCQNVDEEREGDVSKSNVILLKKLIKFCYFSIFIVNNG